MSINSPGDNNLNTDNIITEQLGATHTELSVNNFMALSPSDKINELHKQINALTDAKRKIKVIIRQFMRTYNVKFKDKAEQLVALQAIIKDFIDKIKDKDTGMYRSIIDEIGDDRDDLGVQDKKIFNETLNEEQQHEVKYIYRFLAKIYNTAGFSDDKRKNFDEEVLKEFDAKMREIQEMQERGDLDGLREFADAEETYKSYVSKNREQAEEIEQNRRVKELLLEVQQLGEAIERLQKSEPYMEYLKSKAFGEAYRKDEGKVLDDKITQLQATVNATQTHFYK